MRRIQKKHVSFVRSLGLFAEFQLGRIKGYQNWFNNTTNGVLSILTKNQEDVLKYWENFIKKSCKEIQDATENMFYKEDLLPLIENAQRALKLIDCANKFKKEFQFEESHLYEDEGKQIRAQTQKLNNYSFSKDIDLSSYRSGSIFCSVEEWQYTKEDLTLRKLVTLEQPEEIEFTAQGHQFQFSNPIYGVVLWNNRSLVWTHPKCPYIIRYEWFENKGVFKQHIGTPQEIKGKKYSAPALSDWQMLDGVIRAVTVGTRNPEPEVPEINQWEIGSGLPPPVVLLVATFRFIQATVYQLLGIQEFVATGLDPIL